MLIDTHAHLDFKDYENNLDEIIKRAKKNQVSKIITIGASLEGSKKAVELAREHNEIYAAISIHPESANELDDKTIDLFREFSKDEKVIAIGEIGLDYYVEKFSKEKQAEVFIKQIELAIELNLPIIFHIRNAFEDVMNIIDKYDWHKNKAVVHCYSSSYKKIQSILDKSLMISYTGIITYDEGSQKAVEATPLDKIMIETDCPFLAPVPYRGDINEPAYVKYVAEKVAEIKGISFEEVAEVTTNNAINFFNLYPSASKN
ncbi:MAG: TatD family hydrolase [Parcubacteria group bacterium]|nr:TatD family hydrolase [Parcubacteria group bacterium]